MIAINQDPLGVPGQLIRNDGDVQIFAKRLAEGEAVALLNRGDAPAEIRLNPIELGLHPTGLEIHDLWSGQSHLLDGSTITVTGESHGVIMLRLREATRRE